MWSITGHKRIVEYLQKNLEAGTLTHAFLLTGPPQVGKMTLAVRLAQALNCEAAERPCRECTSCRKIEAANHADVLVVGLEQGQESAAVKSIHIDQIEEMQRSVNLPPFEGKHKVVIIEDAELMSADAANRLLKTLEEPPDGVTFILLTRNERLLLTTIVSRCQRLEMHPLPGDEIVRMLIEQRGVSEDKARLLAGISRGCPGRAISAIDNEDMAREREEILNDITAMINGRTEQRFAYAGKLALQFSKSRNAVHEVLDYWLDFWHDLMLVKLGCRDMIVNIDKSDEYSRLAGEYSGEKIRGCISSIQAAARQLRQNVNPRLALEVLMIDIPGKEGGGSEAVRLSRK